MKLLREPSFQFVALGVVVFLIYAWANDRFEAEAKHRIEITADDVELLSATFQRQWQRPPTDFELENLVEGRIREEVLYREALAVGLDTNDMVVRRRMVQKMDLLSQDLALLADPTDAELQGYFQDHQEDYRISPRLSFSHVYFNADRRGAAVEEDALRVLAEIRAQSPKAQSAPDRGDRFMLGYDFADASTEEVAREFGQQFADALTELEPGWQGPILSGYGLHLVYLEKRIEGRVPIWTEVRDRLVMDFNRTRSERARDALYESLLQKYEVVIAEGAVPADS